MSHAASRHELASVMRRTLREPDRAPTTDTLERALWRAETVAEGFYDEWEIGMKQQCLGDMLTDLVHLADAHRLDIYAALEKGIWMADQERGDWELPTIDRDLPVPDEEEI